MFVLITIVDTIRIPPPLLAQPTLVSVHREMDKKYPNRVIMDQGLVICRYGDARVGDGVCVAGDGGAHHQVLARLVVFRPFVDEVCIGTIAKSNAEGLQVSLGFFDDVFIPAYWMLRPSHYETETGLWVWTPTYDSVKIEEDDEEEETRFEMEIGAEIRFKVKSINFTRVINTAKGVQATTTTTSQSHPTMERSLSVGSESSVAERPVRKRSASADLIESSQLPASMHVVASICEDGLGLTSWWTAADEDDAET
jgi:DNA-directed RNA polymerase subunit E'/Rpb7